MKIFLAGEGKDDLGDWWQPPHYRKGGQPPGVIEALLKRISPNGWEIGGAVPWKNIRAYRASNRGSVETRRVMGAALQCLEAGCDVLVFTRDRDQYPERLEEVRRGLEQAAIDFPGIRLCGGVAIREIESWLLALLGERKSEEITDAKQALHDKGHHEREHKVAIVEQRDPDAVPNDANSFREWRDRVRGALKT